MSYYEDYLSQFNENMGVNLPDALFIIMVLCALILSAKDRRIGIIALLLFSSLWLIIYGYLGWDLTKVTVTLLTSVVIMAVEIFINKKESGGGVI